MKSSSWFGAACSEIRSTELTARPGDVLFYRSGFVHEETSDPKSPVSTLFLAFDTGDPLPWLPLRVHDAQGGYDIWLRGWLMMSETARARNEAAAFRRPFE